MLKDKMFLHSSEDLPNNVKQIGEIEGNVVVYIEDYAYTFLKNLSKGNIETTKCSMLLGRKHSLNRDMYYFVLGAIELDNPIDEDGSLTFKPESMNRIKETKTKYFAEMDILGWFISVPGFEMTITPEIFEIQNNVFGGEYGLFMMMEPIENDEAFYIYENKSFVKKSGFRIFYEKNTEMQEYIMGTEDVIVEEPKPDELMVSIRSILNEKKSKNYQKRMVAAMSTISMFLVMIVLIIGITLINNYDKMSSMEKSINVLSGNVTIGNKEEKNEEETTIEGKEEAVTEDIKPTEQTTQIKESPIPSKEENQSQIPKVYTVQKGDTLAKICRQIYNSTEKLNELCEINGIKDYNYIYEGQVLQLP